MRIGSIIARMEAFPRGLGALLAGLPADEARWKPPSGAWSILEIVCHLGDEEVDDFRARLRLTLQDPSRDWPKIDPEGWARERRYNERDLGGSLERFARERAASVEWLRSLAGADWESAATHPRLGSIRAGDLMASWAAHDALHLRQVAKRLHELAGADAPGFDTGYAGEWRA